MPDIPYPDNPLLVTPHFPCVDSAQFPMAGTLTIAFDVVNQAFVANYLGSASTLPDFRQAHYNTKIYLVQPATNFVQGLPRYEAFDASDFDGLRVGFWSDSQGTFAATDPFLLALTDQTGWDYNVSDPTKPYWTGVINTLTQQIADFIGAGNRKSAFFAVNLTTALEKQVVLDHRGSANVTLLSATDKADGIPINVTGEIPTITLPVHFKSGDNVYSLVETSPGHLEFTWINPS